MVGARDVRVTRLMAEVEQERQLRLKAQQRAAGLQSLNARLRAAVLRQRADEAARRAETPS